MICLHPLSPFCVQHWFTWRCNTHWQRTGRTSGLLNSSCWSMCDPLKHGDVAVFSLCHTDPEVCRVKECSAQEVFPYLWLPGRNRAIGPYTSPVMREDWEQFDCPDPPYSCNVWFRQYCLPFAVHSGPPGTVETEATHVLLGLRGTGCVFVCVL